MGKAADNEQIKQKASWLNNVSVSLFVGGFVGFECAKCLIADMGQAALTTSIYEHTP